MMEFNEEYNFNEYKRIKRTAQFPKEGELEGLGIKELEDNIAILMFRLHKETGCRNIQLVSAFRERTANMKKMLTDCDIYKEDEPQPDFEITIGINTITEKDLKI